LLARFDRVVVHSARGAETLAALGVAGDRLRVISHPAFRSDPQRADDGGTVLCLGAIRPYKGLGDAIEAVSRVDGARLIVAGDPLEEIDGYRRAGGDRVGGGSATWPSRRSTVRSATPRSRSFRTAPSSTSPAPSCRRSERGAGRRVRRRGLGEPVRTFGAGLVVPAGSVDALVEAIRGLLDDEAALAEARAGALRARDELTWDASAAAHLELYREIV
jgi:glycosyltransferase involved in cell wall biosynthesis